MAYTTESSYTGDGTRKDFLVTFPFLESTDVKARVDGTNTSAFSITGTTVTFDTAPPNTKAVLLYRDTDIDTAKITYQTGSSIRAQDLNNTTKQLLYSIQEEEQNTGGVGFATGDKVHINVATANSWTINDNVIAVGNIIDYAVAESKLANSSVSALKLQDDAVTASKLGDLAVAVGNIQDYAVAESKLANSSVSEVKLKDDAVTADKIKDGEVTAGKLDDLAVAVGNIIDYAVHESKLANSSVSEVKLKVDNDPTNDHVLTAKSSASGGLTWAAPGLFSSYAILKHIEGQGSHGGSSGTDWTTRIINTEYADPHGIVSIGSNRFTLQAGNYLINLAASAHDIKYCKLRIYDITNSAERILGHVGAGGTTGYAWGQPNQLTGRLTPSAETVYEAQQISDEALSSTGHGHAAGLGGNETYLTLQIFKEI